MARSRNSVDASLRAALDGLPFSPSQPVAVAFSGGLDSSVLLHAAVLHAGAESVVALHVHHGLQPAAHAWVDHCADQATALGVRFQCLRVEGPPAASDNIEGWARAARYRLLLAACRDAQAVALLTAHHADDQLETVLLAMARGSGLDGLCGIAPRDLREGVLLLRPLLDVPRSAMLERARQSGLTWIDDPSNDDVRLRRNALRHQVLPALSQALPGLGEQLPDVLGQLRQARELVNAQAQVDLQAARCAPRHLSAFDRRSLRPLSQARVSTALRAWLRALGCEMPTAARLAQMQAQLIDANSSQAEVRHDGHLLRRYRDCVVALTAATASAKQWAHGPLTLAPWQGEAHIDLPSAGRLHVQMAPHGLSSDWLREQALQMRAGLGADRLRAQPAGRSRALRNLWQEAGIPPWVRPALPVLCVQGRVLLAAPFGMDRSGDWPWASPGIVLHWLPDSGTVAPELSWFDSQGLGGDGMAHPQRHPPW